MAKSDRELYRNEMHFVRLDVISWSEIRETGSSLSLRRGTFSSEFSQEGEAGAEDGVQNNKERYVIRPSSSENSIPTDISI